MRQIILALGLAAFALPAHAITVDTTQYVQALWRGTGLGLDPMSSEDGKTGANTAGTNLSAGDCDNTGCARLSGFMAADGSSYAGLEIGWVNPQSPPGFAIMEARQRISIYNDNPVYAQDLSFDYELKDMMLYLMAGSGGPQRDTNPFDGPSEAVGVQLGYEVTSGGFVLARHSFTAWGGANPGAQEPFYEFLREGGMGALTERTDCYENVCAGRRYTVTPLSRSLSLGRLGAGQFLDIETRMWVAASGEHREWFADGRIGDPNGLNTTLLTARPEGSSPSPVPLPATGFLLAAGLGLLWLRRGSHHAG